MTQYYLSSSRNEAITHTVTLTDFRAPTHGLKQEIRLSSSEEALRYIWIDLAMLNLGKT